MRIFEINLANPK